MQNTSNNLGFTNREDYLLRVLENAPVGILTFSADWEIDFVNENYSKYGILYNIDSFSLKGLNILEQDLFPGISILKELKELEEGYSFEKEIRNIPTSGRGFISLFVKASPVFAEGRFNGGILVLEDVKTIKHPEEDDIQIADQVDRIANKLYDVFLIVDTQRRIKYLSGKDYSKLISAEDSLIDKPLSRIFQKEQLNKLLQSISSSIEKRSAENLFLEFETGNGTLIYNCRILPYLTKHRQIKFIYIFFENVTEFRNEIILLKNELADLDAYATAAINIPQPVLTTDNSGGIKFFNENARKCFNLTSDAYNKFLGDVIGNFDVSYFNKIKEELDNNGFMKTTLSVFKENKQKETYEVKFVSTNNSSHPIIITCRDVTDQTVIESRLKSSEESFRSIINQAGEMICSTDVSGEIFYTNNTFCERLGYSADEVLGQNLTKFIAPDYLASNVFEVSLFDQNKTKIDLPLLDKKGERVPALANFISTVVEKTGRKNFTVYLVDISERKQVEKELELYNALFESASDGIALSNNGKIILCNDSFAEIFGYKNSKELISSPLLDLASNDDILKVAEFMQMLETNKSVPGRFEFLGRRKDNTQFYCEVTAATFIQDKKTYIVFVSRDITERKRAQQAIRESEEKYRNITENIDDFLYTFERTGKILRPVFYTSSVERITGYSQAEFLTDSRLILKIIHPDDLQDVDQNLKDF